MATKKEKTKEQRIKTEKTRLIFSAFVYSTNGGEEKEAADGEADTTEEGNRVAVQDE